MLDTESLRVAFGVLALTLMALFYFVAYRTTRSVFAGWWCASLGLYLGGASAHLLDGTHHQVWGNPLGNVLIVSGSACVLAGARSLHNRTLRWWEFAAAPCAVGVLSAIDDPGDNIWSGGPYYLGAMWVLLGLAAIDLWSRYRADASAATAEGRMHQLSLWSISAACGLVAAYYFSRWVAFLAVGWRDPVFETYFGSNPTTLLTSVLLATVSFSMSALSDEQQKAALRNLASRDGLTGLLNRAEFLRRAASAVRRIGEQHGPGQLILADLDHFKQINDEHGHLAGDRAIARFAHICTTAVRATDLVGRYGGEEFIILLDGAGPGRATQLTDSIRDAMQRTSALEGIPLPTVSFGLVSIDDSADLEETIARADSALYQAKAEGRNRSVHYLPGRRVTPGR
jgi:diguanylate cyclase (GGDEF)-like protein